MDEVADVLMGESGSAFGKAYFEAGFAVDILRTAAGECRRVFGQVQQQEAGEISMIRRLPLGVVAGIAPFNFPLLLALKKGGLCPGSRQYLCAQTSQRNACFRCNDSQGPGRGRNSKGCVQSGSWFLN